MTGVSGGGGSIVHRSILSLCNLHQSGAQTSILALQSLDGFGVCRKDAMAELVGQQMEGIMDRSLVNVAEDVLQRVCLGRLADGQRDEEQQEEMEADHGVFWSLVCR